MIISRTKLESIVEETGFQINQVEKVIQLLNLLNAIDSHPFLKDKLVLKGGTALNLFVFKVPRLSVDIDLNYTGKITREEMLAERPQIEQALQAVFSREGFTVRRIPTDHAGGKWSLQYQSYSGRTANLEVDLNFMFRVSLWEPKALNSHKLGEYSAENISILDIHELAAGKLAALFSRKQGRDLFDVYHLFKRENFNQNMLRLAFVVFGALNRKDWRTISLDDIQFEAEELRNNLVPVLSYTTQINDENIIDYSQKMIEECKKSLSAVLPFSEKENEFLNELLTNGNIIPSLLTENIKLQERISNQPMLLWKAVHVKKYIAPHT